MLQRNWKRQIATCSSWWFFYFFCVYIIASPTCKICLDRLSSHSFSAHIFPARSWVWPGTPAWTCLLPPLSSRLQSHPSWSSWTAPWICQQNPWARTTPWRRRRRLIPQSWKAGRLSSSLSSSVPSSRGRKRKRAQAGDSRRCGKACRRCTKPPCWGRGGAYTHNLFTLQCRTAGFNLPAGRLSLQSSG